MVVEIKFRSAKIVIPNTSKAPSVNGADILFDVTALRRGAKIRNRDENEYRLRTEGKNIADRPFGYEQVSNLLHVLLGQRPVPSTQGTIRKRSSAIDDIAKEAYYRIDNVSHTAWDEDRVRLFTGISKGRKVKQNSNRQDLITVDSNGFIYKGSVITWRTLRGKLFVSNIELYDKVMEFFKRLYGSDDFKKLPLVDLIRYLADEKGYKDELVKFFDENQLKPLSCVVLKANDCKGFNACSPYNSIDRGLVQRCTNSTPIHKLSLDGSIWVDVPHQWLPLLFSGKRVATFLDGGYAEIGGICNTSMNFLGSGISAVSSTQK